MKNSQTHAGLAQEIGFAPACLQSLIRLSQAGEICARAGEECNKYDLTATPCFRLADHDDWSKWFAITSPPPVCSVSFSYMCGVAKEIK
jgi:hypothetical protein